MRKKLSVLLIAVLLIATCGTSEPVKASGGEYIYREYDDGSDTPKKAWFINGEQIEGNPEVIEEQSQVRIETTPDDSCAAYLADFYEPTTRVTVGSDVTVTFGSEETKASIQWLTCYNANVTVYAEDGEFLEDGSLPGSVYGVSSYNSIMNFNGNIQYLCLGDEFMYGEDEEKVNAGDIVVNGSVYTVEWYKTTEYAPDVYYRGFTGNVSVSGDVGVVYVREIRHSNVLNADFKATVGECWERIPSFVMRDGILSEETEEYINFFEPDMENFYFEYAPAGDENGNWWATARYPSGEETGVGKMVSAEEMQAVLESGTGRISIGSWNNSDINIGDYDLSELKVTGGKIKVNNITTQDGNGLLQVDSYGRDVIDITVNGDVDRCRISFTRFNENMNIDVNGTIKQGQVYKFSMQSDFPIDLGTFTSTDMPLFVDGIWNPDLFLTLGTTEYHPVDDILLENALGLEKTTNQSGEEISEMADMFIDEMKSDTLNYLDTDDDFQTCVDKFEGVDVLTGLDIELKKFDYNETTGEVSNQEVVTELGDKDLAISVKVPEQEFDQDKEYIIIREHDNNGTKEMDVLIPVQDGDKLTFKTNKFSSFIVVEVDDNYATEEEEKPITPPADEEEEEKPVTPPANEEEEEKGLVHSAELKDKEDVAGKIELSEEEKTAIANGENLEVVLTFNDAGKNATTEEQKAIVGELGNKKIGTFLEIDLLKKIGDSEVKVSETTGKVAITFEISAELKNTDTSVIRKYSILRYHNQSVDVLDAQYDEVTGTISFETDKFSTYALVYEDVAKTITKDEVPVTGDTTSALMYMMLLCFGVGTIAVALRKQKNG
ncbi:MAG: hypothetical protein IJE49_12505 [Agathobacter sp.]|nr:hypothetical protein [Agathobacter sp.]MBQ2902647.1 hypothetical protein [Agathobacter sp.]